MRSADRSAIARARPSTRPRATTGCLTLADPSRARAFASNEQPESWDLLRHEARGLDQKADPLALVDSTKEECGGTRNDTVSGAELRQLLLRDGIPVGVEGGRV